MNEEENRCSYLQKSIYMQMLISNSRLHIIGMKGWNCCVKVQLYFKGKNSKIKKKNGEGPKSEKEKEEYIWLLYKIIIFRIEFKTLV